MTDNTSTALITGGTSGIGLATAKKLAQLGIHVLVVGRNAERGKKAVDEIRTAGGKSDFISSELLGAEAVRTLGVMPEDLALVAVETVQPVLRTKPDEPVVVLHNIGDSDLGESRTRGESSESDAPPLDHWNCQRIRGMRFTCRHWAHEHRTAQQNGSACVSEGAQVALSQSRRLSLEFQSFVKLIRSGVRALQPRKWNTNFPFCQFQKWEGGAAVTRSVSGLGSI